MSKTVIVPGERYHLFNRSLDKKPLFLTERDYTRMLFYFLFFQSTKRIFNISDYVKDFEIKGIGGLPEELIKAVLKNRTVELELFCMAPTHFHLAVRELVKGGISRYIQRIEGGFTRYFNVKNERSGYIFQGPFQAVHIVDNSQFLYLSTYIHKHPYEIEEWRGAEEQYPWSSYPDYIEENRWGDLLTTDHILRQFSSRDEYKGFVQSSPAKNIDEILI